MAFLMCAQTALLVSHPHCLHVAVVLLLPRRLYHHARHAPGTLLALPPQGPSCPPSPRLCMGGPGFVLRKPRICRPARSRTCDVAHFGLNLHGAMEETWHHVALGVFLAPPLTLGAYGQLQPMLSSQK